MAPGDTSVQSRLHRHRLLVIVLLALLTAGLLLFCLVSPAPLRLRPTRVPEVSASPSATPTAISTPTSSPTSTPTATRTPTPSPSAPATRTTTPRPTPAIIRAKIEIVWPHDSAPVREANLANITAYLITESGSGGSVGLPEPPPCDWNPTVRLWVAANAQPARPVATGQKRITTVNEQRFPVWDFNDIDVSAARDPATKLSFFVTVDGVSTLHNVWVHTVDARTIFPQTDAPTAAVSRLPAAVDARIEIVWPHNDLPLEQATLANVSAYLFAERTFQAFAPTLQALPAVRLHWSLNTDPEEDAASASGGIVGTPRAVTAVNGIEFLAWDFNNVDVSAARESLNRLYFWVSVDGVETFPNVWTHGTDARTIFPQPDALKSCQ